MTDRPAGLPSTYSSPPGRSIGRLAERQIRPVHFGADPFCNNPQICYDCLQMRRNVAYASFCCGAGSVHRHNAPIEAAIRAWVAELERSMATQQARITALGAGEADADISDALR